MVIKLDMERRMIDKIGNLLENVLRTLVSQKKWINWNMEYITTKTLSVLVDGIPSE